MLTFFDGVDVSASRTYVASHIALCSGCSFATIASSSAASNFASFAATSWMQMMHSTLPQCFIMVMSQAEHRWSCIIYPARSFLWCTGAWPGGV